MSGRSAARNERADSAWAWLSLVGLAKIFVKKLKFGLFFTSLKPANPTLLRSAQADVNEAALVPSTAVAAPAPTAPPPPRLSKTEKKKGDKGKNRFAGSESAPAPAAATDGSSPTKSTLPPFPVKAVMCDASTMTTTTTLFPSLAAAPELVAVRPQRFKLPLSKSTKLRRSLALHQLSSPPPNSPVWRRKRGTRGKKKMAETKKNEVRGELMSEAKYFDRRFQRTTHPPFPN